MGAAVMTTSGEVHSPTNYQIKSTTIAVCGCDGGIALGNVNRHCAGPYACTGLFGAVPLAHGT
ncbi:hypothetical protein D2Q93_07880 [Alicyclobacillaceae bacterium I2511]|nr:hypothetical protein D2Q93_07880 [Alicyclobacillaceae bacterium I2511]